MNASEYQKKAARTLVDRPPFEIDNLDLQPVWSAVLLGITAGSVAEHIKKGVFHQHGVDNRLLDYQLETVRDSLADFFANHIKPRLLSDNQLMLLWNVIGLVGEAGEVAGLIFNSILSGNLDREKIAKELGDCLWYIAAICTKAGLDLSVVMADNIGKLEKRYPNGYSSQDSQARVDTR